MIDLCTLYWVLFRLHFQLYNVGRNISALSTLSTFLPASIQEVHSRDPSEPGKSSLESGSAKRTWIQSWGGGSTSLVRAAVPIVAARCTWMWWSLRWWWWAPLEDPSGTRPASRVGLRSERLKAKSSCGRSNLQEATTETRPFLLLSSRHCMRLHASPTCIASMHDENDVPALPDKRPLCLHGSVYKKYLMTARW